MAPDEQVSYDVAISFLGDDASIAQEIRDRISPSLNTFLFTHRQEDVAGTDALERFRLIFRERSRLVVVLYRPGWGETPWTRVEKEAVTDRFLAEGPGFLFWVMLDRDSRPPPWVPERMIRFNLEDYGVEQAAGAIKARARELGSEFRKETPVDRAKRLQELEAFEKDRSILLGSEAGVRAAQEAVERLFAAITRHVDAVRAAAPELQIESGNDHQTMILRGKTCSVGVYWYYRYVNTLHDAALRVTEFQGRVLFPGQHGYYVTDPKELATELFRPDLTRTLGWCWRPENGAHVSSEELADQVVDRLLANSDRVARGQLPRQW